MFIQFPHVDITVKGMEAVKIPPMIKIRQKFDGSKITNIYEYVFKKLNNLGLQGLQGKRICITAGSRGIPDMPTLYKAVVDFLISRKANPFIVPAMGSHANATAEGQLDLLARYGLTEESIGCPILSSMDVVEYGVLDNGTHLYCDKYASEADGIIILNKVKPHTDFHGEHESGLCKMIAIGISKHMGATSFHSMGFEHFAEYLPKCASMFLSSFPIVCGIGLVQNAYDEICSVEAAKPEGLLALDAALLREAKERIAKFMFKDLDLLIIDQIGKEISGYGADPNVTGRTNGIQKDFDNTLNVNKLFIAGLTDKTHNTASGLAQADITTRRCLNSVDWSSTWTNIVTSGRIRGCAIPMYVDTDKEAIRLALHCCSGADSSNYRVARIKTTLDLFEIQISPALYHCIKDNPAISIIEEAHDMAFDSEDFLIPCWS